MRGRPGACGVGRMRGVRGRMWLAPSQPRADALPRPQDCYESFVCVENAQTSKEVTVAPGDSWRATTTFAVVDL